MRIKIFYWFYVKVFKVKEGCMFPKGLRFIYFLLFPIQYMIIRYERSTYDFLSDTYKWGKTRLSGRTWNDFINMKDGTIFKLIITQRGDENWITFIKEVKDEYRDK